MYKINCHHKMKPKSQIETEFFFNNYKINNDFFEKDIFMRLPQVKKEFKVKNENEAFEHKELICVRRSEKISSYYISPSIFINKKDNNKCKTLINNFLKNEIYNKLNKKLEKRVIDIFDELKIRKIEITKFRELIIDFVEDIDKDQKYKYDHKKTIIMLEDLNKKENIPLNLLNIFKEKYNKISINKNITEEEKRILKEKKILKKIRKENEEKVLKKIEAKKNEIYEFKERKIKFIEDALTTFINDNNEYYNLFNNKAKLIIRKYFKASLEIILKSEDSLKDNELFKKHLESFLFFDNEKKDFLIKNNYILPLLNCDFLQFEYNYIINSLKKEVMKSLENHIISFNNRSVKKSIKINNNIKINFIIKLDKETHSEIDFDEINKYTSPQIINNLFEELIQNESIIKDNNYIEMLYNKKIEYYPKISIELNDIKTYKRYIEEELKKNIIGKLILPNCNDNIKRYEISQSKKLQVYKDMFEKARARNREITYYAGKTNSGKTYQAFEELKKYNSGIYLAPLRLLAAEGQEEIEKRGMECSLLTGEERDLKPNAKFISSTIEMLNTEESYDVAIIDEIQMINNLDRGAAWLQALVGVNAKKVIILGSSEVKKIIFNLSNYLEETLIYKEFERKSPLKITNHIKENKKLEPNSAIIAFSKKELFRLKQKYEKLGNKVSIIYGKLPPSVKIKESEKFRNGITDVLVSTDAIGMGLNLPIKNIYFNEIQKYNGFNVSLLDPSLVKQIAGRAGRYGKFENGYVSSFSKYNNEYIKKCLNEDTKIDNPKFSTKINLPIFNELLNINKKRDIKEIVELSKQISFDITRISYVNSYDNISEIINKYSNKLSNNEIVNLLNAPINEDYNDIYIDAFKVIFKNLMRNKNKILNEDDFGEIYENILNNIKFNTTEKEYKLLDLFHFFTFNFKEFNNFENKIKEYKSNASIEIMSNLIKNINEDELNYYYGY